MKTKESKLKVVKNGPEFQPDLSYQWKPDDVFQLSGIELDFLNRAIEAILNTPEAQRVVQAMEVKRILTGIIKSGVENGIIVPLEESK